MTTEARDQKIGPTAHYTAYAWHRLGLPYAEHFTTPRGRALYWAFRGAGEWIALARPGTPLLVEVLAARHRTIDAEVVRLRPDRVVEIGAGLSRRGLTLAADHGVRVTEIDLPHMVERKRALLGRLPAALRARTEARLDVVAHDILAPGFGAVLRELVRDAERPIVIAEGVMGYFADAERLRIASAVREGLGSRAGGAFLCELRDGEVLEDVGAPAQVLRAAIRLVTRNRGLRPDYASVAEVRDLFRRAGFASAEPVPLVRPARAGIALPIRVWHAGV